MSIDNLNSIKNYGFSYKMVDISKKRVSFRKACVMGSIYVGENVIHLIDNNKISKGDPIILAEVAGINAVKNVSNLILLSHQINIENILINIVTDKDTVYIYCIVYASSKTGVEIEAMMGTVIALLTVYDLTKKVNPYSYINDVRMLFKSGGKNGTMVNNIDKIPTYLKNILFDDNSLYSKLRVFILVMSDRASSGVYEDKSGELISNFFSNFGAAILGKRIISDDYNEIVNIFSVIINDYEPDLIITTGGTGLSSRDVTYLAVNDFCVKIIPGIGELLRIDGANYSKNAWLSSSIAGIYNKTLIISLPGSPLAVNECLFILKDIILHAVETIKN